MSSDRGSIMHEQSISATTSSGVNESAPRPCYVDGWAGKFVWLR